MFDDIKKIFWTMGQVDVVIKPFWKKKFEFTSVKNTLKKINFQLLICEISQTVSKILN